MDYCNHNYLTPLLIDLLNWKKKNSEEVKLINSENILNCEISINTFPVALFWIPLQDTRQIKSLRAKRNVINQNQKVAQL